MDKVFGRGTSRMTQPRDGAKATWKSAEQDLGQKALAEQGCDLAVVDPIHYDYE